MKRVLLLGDSIRIGYCEKVGELLKDRAQVCWPQENCRFALYALAALNNWAWEAGEPETIDVVHWNCGHWDCARFGGSGDRPLVTVEEYADALERVHERIRTTFPNAQIIFALTTTALPGVLMSAPRTNEEIGAYNRAAARVMEKLNVPVNDLFSVAQTIPAEDYADAVHFKPEGYQVLAEAVVRAVEKYI